MLRWDACARSVVCEVSPEVLSGVVESSEPCLWAVEKGGGQWRQGRLGRRLKDEVWGGMEQEWDSGEKGE